LENNKNGADWDKGIKRGGRREERCLMSLEEEHDFLKSIEHEALNGQIITCKQVQSRFGKQNYKSQQRFDKHKI
jgi:hypothetical protein